MAATLVLGLGNTILRDEGLGVRSCERLVERYRLADEVAAIEGGTLGLHLLPHLEGVRNLLIIDAVAADHPPGSLVRLEGAAIPTALAHKLSLHQFGLAELLALGSTLGAMPSRIVLWGMVPALIEPGLELSEAVSAALDTLIAAVVDELRAWGVPPALR